jgi:DNA-binding transcriptional regulator of glucitol operon
VRYEEEPPPTRKPETVTEIPAGMLPERPKPQAAPRPEDPVLIEYNAYLARLAEADQQDRRTTA